MALPIRPNNSNTPIPNNPFYTPETTYFQGPYYPSIIDSASGIGVNPDGTITVTGGGGGGGAVSKVSGGAGITVTPSGGTGNVTVTNSGVLSLTAGSGISLTGSTGNITISSSIAGGTVTNVIGSAPIAVVSGTTTPIISVATASTTSSGVTTLVNNLITNDSTKALTAAQGYQLQQQISSLVVGGGLVLAGTYNAATQQMVTVTSAGSSKGFTVGTNLPLPAPGNNNYFVIVTTPGTLTPPGGFAPVTATQGDWLLSNGTNWSLLDVGFNAPAATTTVAGVVRLATLAETQAGTDSTIALTPASAAGTYVPRACVTAKGTLIAGSAANTPSALPIGTVGQVLTVDPACATGMKWAAPTGGGGGTGTVTSVATGPGLTGGTITTAGTLDLVNRGITPGAFSNPTINVNCYGVITSITSGGAAIPCSLLTAKGQIIGASAASTPVALGTGADGYILAACSAAASGLCWIPSPAVSAAIPCSAITGKGAILTGTAANAPTALPVGVNGAVLSANPACATGLEWILPSNGGTVPPATPAIGELWYDTTSTPPILKAWDGTNWLPVSLTGSTTAPTSPTLGQTWINTSVTPPAEYIWNGTTWTLTNFTGSDTPPASPVEGQTWMDTTASPPIQYVWNGTQWVPTSYTGNLAAPTSPILGQTWVNTSVTPPTEYIWNGTAWVPTGNVASNTAPTSPILGQLWNDTSVSPPELNTWNGTAWVPQSVSIGTTAPTSPTIGQVWSDTSGPSPVLKSWNGTSWVAVGTGTVTSITAGTGLNGGTITTSGTINLANTTVTPGSYTYTNLTVDAQGRITAASSGASPTGGTVTNVATGTGLTGGPITSTGTIALANTAVAAGSYTYSSFTVDAQGRLTAASSGTNPVTSITAGTGLNGGTITNVGTISLANTAVSAGSYTNASFTVDAQGRLTAASSGLAPVTAISGTSPIGVTGGTTPVVSICSASTTQAGAVQLYDARNSTSTTLALTAAQGKALQDQIDTLAASGGLQLAGTINASTGLVATVTSAGTTDGFIVGNGLPAASVTTNNDYVIVTTAGTFTPPGGSSTAATQGDWFVVSETSPGVYAWTYLNVGYDPVYATTTTCGVVCLSTNALAQAGVDTLTALTPAAAASAYIPKTCITNKGTIITGTAASTPVALPVGGDGCALIACAACSSGLTWGSVAVTAATPVVAGILLGCTASNGCGTALGCNALLGRTTGTGNVGVGHNAGCGITAGFNNTAIGSCAGDSITTACWNVAVGASAGCSNVTGNGNVAIGTSAGCIATGACSVFIGLNAGDNATSGSQNVLIGACVQAPVAAGSCQLAIGFSSTDTWLTGCSNRNIRPTAGVLDCTGSAGTAGQFLTATGTNGLCWITPPALTDATPIVAGVVKGCTNNIINNTFLGCNAGLGATGCDNVFVGSGAACAGVTGIRNVVIGTFSGCALTSGCLNTVVGGATAYALSTGCCNTFLGHGTGRCVSTDCNTLVGTGAGFNITTGTCNVALGNNALGLFGGAPNTACGNTAIGTNALTDITSGSVNVAVGWNAGCNITTGCQNNVIGQSAGCSLTTGNFNVLLGQITGCSLVTGCSNTFLGGGAGMCATGGCQTLVGFVAGGSISTGLNNTALGYEALGFLGAITSNTGNDNTAVGQCSLRATTTGSGNTAVGCATGILLTTGSCNTLLGWRAGCALTSGCFNVVVGNSTGIGLTTGCRNVFLGGGAGSCATTSSNNVFLGDLSGCGTTTGFNNVAIGYLSMLAGSTSQCSVAVGMCALKSSTTGCGNTAVGYNSMNVLSTGIGNTALGWDSSCSLTTGCFNITVGQWAGKAITTGTGNVALGANSATNLSTGSYNTYLGDNAGTNVTSGNLNVAIGNQVQLPSATGSCQLAIGFGPSQNWLTGDCNKNIRPGAGIIDCTGSIGSYGQALLSNGAGSLYWSGGYGDTPVGAIMMFAANSVPGAWLVADGRAVSRSTYSALFATIGTTYGAGDGTTTFNLPDLRGQFLRGWDAAGGTSRNLDSGRTFGSNQAFAMQPITGNIYGVAESFAMQSTPCLPTPGNALFRSDTGPWIYYTPSSVDGSAGGTLCLNSALVTNTACETRPTNVAMLPCIKWQLTSAPSSCGIPCSTLTGKGAIVTATATDTPTALPLGGEGNVIVVCNACPTGMTWSYPVVVSAWSNQAQNIPAGTKTEIIFNNVPINAGPGPGAGSNYVTGSIGGNQFWSFRPTVSGYYQFNAGVVANGSNAYWIQIRVEKFVASAGTWETVAWAETVTPGAYSPSIVTSGITYLNYTGPSNDALRVTVQPQYSTTLRIDSDANRGNYFSAHLIR